MRNIDKMISLEEREEILEIFKLMVISMHLLILILTPSIYQLIQKGELTNGALAKILSLSEGSITHHIKKLDDAGLIIGRNKGHFIIYYTTEGLKKKL